MKIGLITDCLKQPLPEAIATAAGLGVDGVQIYATKGTFSPNTLTDADKANYKALLAANGLKVSALCGDMGGFGFEREDGNAARVAETKKIIDLAVEFGTDVVTTHIGVIPSDPAEYQYGVMLEALTECGLYAKSRGVTLAIETGPEKAVTLGGFVSRTKGGVGVNLDPANFVMVTGQDPVEAVKILGEFIVHTHVKDGVMLKRTDPKIIYDCFATGGIEGLNVADYFRETPIGEGNVDFPAYFRALAGAGYDGYLTIEREAGQNRLEDISGAVGFIRNTLKNL